MELLSGDRQSLDFTFFGGVTHPLIKWTVKSIPALDTNGLQMMAIDKPCARMKIATRLCEPLVCIHMIMFVLKAFNGFRHGHGENFSGKK